MNLSYVIFTFGTLSILNFARKTKEKLKLSSDAEVVALADRLQAAMDDLSLAYSARRPLLSLWKKATEIKNAADVALDTLIAALSYNLLSPVYLNKNRNHPDYRALFPDGTIAFIHGPERQEIVQVNAMVAYLKQAPDHPMAAMAGDLEMKVNALDAALEPAVRAEGALRSAQDIEKDKRQALGRALYKLKADLHSHFMDKTKEDAFFPTIAESKVEEDETPDAADPV